MKFMNKSTEMAALFSNFQQFHGSHGDRMTFSIKMLLFPTILRIMRGSNYSSFKESRNMFKRYNYHQVLNEQLDVKGSV